MKTLALILAVLVTASAYGQTSAVRRANAASTDNTLVKHDGTGGKLVQDTGVVVNDSDVITASGFINSSITNLSSGTALTVNTLYYDTFSADRTFTISGSPSEGSFITVFATMSSDVTLTYPSTKRLLEESAGTNATLYPVGFHKIVLEYRNAAWWLIDSGGALNNLSATTAPAVTDDVDLGYGVGSLWLDVTNDNSYICTDNGDGVAVWSQIDGTQTYRYLSVSAGAMIPETTSGAAASTKEYATNDVDIDVLAFDGASTEGVQFTWPSPLEWDAGTVKMKLLWDADTGASAADVVSFDVAANSLANDDAIDAAFGTAVEVDDTVIAVGDLHITAASAAITIGGTPTAGDLVLFKIERDHDDAADDMTEDLLLLGVILEYTVTADALSGW